MNPKIKNEETETLNYEGEYNRLIEENARLSDANAELCERNEVLKDRIRNICEERERMRGEIDGLKFALRCNGISGSEVC